jgi:hypothetical protein
MKIRCIYNTGEDIRPYENRVLNKNELGRFGATGYTQFGLTIGKEYLVMGMLLGEGSLDYLIDDGGYVSAYPYPLFEVIDNKLPSNWFFRSLKNTDEFYPYQEAIWGYYELVFDDTHYEKLVDADETAMRTYFKRKIELEKKIMEVEEW